ncbi:MAG: excinuclease ABC subunit UvrC, partial [Candidatus Peregrinibacteria bacterium]
MHPQLKKIIAKAPTTSGVYKFLSEKHESLYIGKAKNLKKRLQSYSRPSAKHTPKIEKMLEHAVEVEWIKTNNEVESLILEDNLVKELQPKYNVMLRDDKNFQYIKVSVGEDYPQITTVRRITERDGAKYFGPKTSGGDVQRLMESVKKIFRLCSVKNIKLDPKGKPLEGAKVAVKIGLSPAKRPCLDFHIKRCTGPCAGMVTPEEYKKQIDAAVNFLSGNYKPAIEALKEQMAAFAKERKFERAAALRDQIHAIERSAQKQLITDTALPDRDVIAFVEDLGKNYFVLFQIRAGKLIAQERFVVEGDETPGEVMEAFLRDYYARAADIPKEIFISVEVEDGKLLENYIRKFADHAVHLFKPIVGHKDDLVMLAQENARAFADASRVSWEATEHRAEVALEELAKVLKLDGPPKRIECYDISHLGGTETMGSMVVFKKGKPVSADYRQFRLRSTANQNDDFKSLEEVITRRLNYLPAQLPEGYKIRKAKKADLGFIQSTTKRNAVNREDLKAEQFQVLTKGKRIVGFCRERALSDAV